MDQRTSDWLTWRGKGIGSSDAPIIMNASPWTTVYQLWQRHTNRVPRDTSTNFAMERGNRLEPKARALYEMMVSLDFPPVTMECKAWPIARASLDGWNEEFRKVLEIKCPGKADHDLALEGKVPEKYKWQLVHQMMVADAVCGDYVSYHPDYPEGKQLAIVPVQRVTEWEQELYEAEVRYWKLVESDTAPELSERDYVEVRDAWAKDLAEQYQKLKAQADELEAQLAVTKQELIDRYASKGAHLRIGALTLTRTSRKGAVAYAKIPEVAALDPSYLEKFRGKAVESVTVRVTEAKAEGGKLKTA